MSRLIASSAVSALRASYTPFRRGAVLDQSSSARSSVAAMPVARTARVRSRETTMSVPSRPPSLSEPSFIAFSGTNVCESTARSGAAFDVMDLRRQPQPPAGDDARRIHLEHQARGAAAGGRDDQVFAAFCVLVRLL